MFATFRFQGSYRDFKKHHGLNELVETIISFQVTLLKLKSISRNYKHSKALHPIRGIAGNISLDLRLRVWEDSIRLEDTEGYYVGICGRFILSIKNHKGYFAYVMLQLILYFSSFLLFLCFKFISLHYHNPNRQRKNKH